MEGCNRGRRVVLAALAAWAVAMALPAVAQNPQITEAQAASRAWLALADANDAVASYNAAAKRFHDTMSVDQWTVALTQARTQFGAVKHRTMLGAQPPNPGKDVPPGEFMIVVFRTEFDKRVQGTETLTLERESDGKWRVVGYLMR